MKFLQTLKRWDWRYWTLATICFLSIVLIVWWKWDTIETWIKTQWAKLRGKNDEAPADPTLAPNPQGGARGLRNYNPGNIIKKTSLKFRGVISPGTDPKFLQFTDMQTGASAMLSLLRRYVDNGHDTITKIVTRWAGGAYPNYIGHVEKVAGIDRHATIIDEADLWGIMQAMAEFENGAGKVTDDIRTEIASATIYEL